MLHVTPVGRETIDAWPVDGSGLPVRVVNSVLTAGVTTVGQLRAQSDQALLALRSLGRISLGHIRSFFKLCGQIEQGRQSFNSIRELLPLFLDGPEMKVITARYGLELEELASAGSGATLQEIGDAEHKTRERVRQIQETAIQKLRSRLATVCLEPFHGFFAGLLEARGSSATCADISALKNEAPAGGYNLCGILMLLGELHPKRITSCNGFFSTLSEQTIRTLESQAIELLNRAAKPVALDDILKSTTVPPPTHEGQKNQLLSCILDHCTIVAATLDHRYFTYERGTEAFLVEVLKDLERPIHYRKVTNAFNDRLKPLSRKGAGFVLEALNAASRCTRVDRGIYDLKAG
jgi:hypothetical protein